MAVSMAVRALAAAAVLAVAGCGGGDTPAREVRLLAPVWVTDDVGAFERETGCRVDLRVYDAGEDLSAIARRRDVDVIAEPVQPGPEADETEDFVRITLEGGIEVTIPKKLARAFDRPAHPAGRRSIVWRIRTDGDNPGCARQWVAYARSQ